jgi:hypothetical protein
VVVYIEWRMVSELALPPMAGELGHIAPPPWKRKG